MMWAFPLPHAEVEHRPVIAVAKDLGIGGELLVVSAGRLRITGFADNASSSAGRREGQAGLFGATRHLLAL